MLCIRLFTIECMAGDYETWARPDLPLWEEPGTDFVDLAALHLKIANLRGGMVKYCCQGKPLQAVMKEVEAEGHKIKQVMPRSLH